MKKLKGVIQAMTTPFTADEQLDLNAISEQVEFAIKNKIDCLYPTGTTGEMYLMSCEEREAVAEKVVATANGRVTVYIHVGAMTQSDTIRLAKHAEKIGADGIGVVTPSYFGVSDKAMVKYYEAICQSVSEDFPVYAYSIPQLAKNDLSVEVLNSIVSTCKNLVGIKYSFPDFRKLMAYMTVNNGNFSVLFGGDDMFLPALVAGAEGVVSGCSNPFPELFSNIYDSYKKGDLKKALEQQRYANEVIFLMKSGADMSIFKNIMKWRGINAGYMRAPLPNLSESDMEKLYEDIKKYL